MKNTRAIFTILGLIFIGMTIGFIIGIAVEKRTISVVDEIERCVSMGGEFNAWYNASAKDYELDCLKKEKSEWLFKYRIFKGK